VESRGRFTFRLRSTRFLRGLRGTFVVSCRSLRLLKRREPRLEPHEREVIQRSCSRQPGDPACLLWPPSSAPSAVHDTATHVFRKTQDATVENITVVSSPERRKPPRSRRVHRVGRVLPGGALCPMSTHVSTGRAPARPPPNDQTHVRTPNCNLRRPYAFLICQLASDRSSDYFLTVI